MYKWSTIRLCYLKCDQDVGEIGKGNVDDLSKLSYLDEDKLIEELCIRYKNGQIYVIHLDVFFQIYFIKLTCFN